MTKFLSLDWFKNKIEESVDKAISNKIEIKLEKLINTEEPEETFKLKSIKLINNVLNVITENNEVFTKLNATEEDFYKVEKVKNVIELKNILISEEAKKDLILEEIENFNNTNFNNGLEKLKLCKEFTVHKDNFVTFKKHSRSIPKLILEKFISILNENSTDLNNNVEFQALKKFTYKCFLNPNAQSAEDLYGFLSKHQFKIDKHGNFYAYRRVVSKENDNKELIEFISNTYNKVKAVWKKPAQNYYVFFDLTKYLIISENSDITTPILSKHWKLIGRLDHLYLDLPNMQEKNYTSSHTGKEDYRVGQIHSMPRNEGDDNNNISCSKG